MGEYKLPCDNAFLRSSLAQQPANVLDQHHLGGMNKHNMYGKIQVVFKNGSSKEHNKENVYGKMLPNRNVSAVAEKVSDKLTRDCIDGFFLIVLSKKNWFEM